MIKSIKIHKTLSIAKTYKMKPRLAQKLMHFLPPIFKEMMYSQINNIGRQLSSLMHLSSIMEMIKIRNRFKI